MARVEDVLEQLYRERYVGFRNAIAPVAGSREAARDVVQEAFARALRDARKLRRHDSAAAWVWRIALNLALQERRRGSLDELPDDLTIDDPHRDPDLAAAVQTLPPRRRLIVFLRYYADFSYAEIAEAMDVAPGTVAATIAQAHTALLDMLLTKEMARDHRR
jgi:RNA polymerase sigma-70 factor (ECF subfamily)